MNQGAATPPRLPPADAARGLLGRAADGMSSLVGLEKVRGFSAREFFSQVFRRRSVLEIEDHLMAGAQRTTPEVLEASAQWPKPWLFARMLAAALLAYGLLSLGWLLFGNAKFLPGMMVIGSFVMPAAVLVLFYELNAPGNVSMLLVLRMLVVGGALSLVASLVLFWVGADLSGLLGASAAGFVEETGKLAAVVFAARKLSPVRYRYTLNGLLFGAAVGAGFSAFESAGYAFEYLLKSKNAEVMTQVLLTRGLLSPLGHPLWTAITAAALWRVKGARSFDSGFLASGSFVRLFVFSVLCHVAWNSPLQLPFLLKYLLLGAAGWWVAVSLVQDGLRQLRAEQLCAQRLKP